MSQEHIVLISIAMNKTLMRCLNFVRVPSQVEQVDIPQFDNVVQEMGEAQFSRIFMDSSQLVQIRTS